MNRFNRARLISFDDPAYQQHVAQMYLQRANNRAIQPPSQRDLFGKQAEEIIRQALGQHFELSDRRILEYEERRGRGVQRKFRELDAVAIGGHTHVHVWEIKASRSAGALHRALRQLRDTQAILQLLFRSVSLSVVLVDTGIITDGDQALLAADPDAPPVLPQTLNQALAEHPDVRRIASLSSMTLFAPEIELAVLRLDDLISLAGDRTLALDWDQDDDVPDAPAPSSAPLYSTADADDDNPFAAALRKATTKSQH